MPKINVLPKHISDLIAAGEVVERPSSVVKEVMENSIDAGAEKITVEIKNGGISYIRVTDDGCGISREDVPKAFLSHATSKIKDEHSLEAIGTLGFRGEALASVAAVSRVEMMTRVKGDFSGTHYVIEGGEEKENGDAGCPDGTTIIIRDIFFNTPARMKFLKKDVSEGNAVAAVVDRIALSHPEVSVRFIRDGKQTLLTPGDNKLISAVYSVLGKDFASSLLDVDYEMNGVKVTGFTGKPLAARASRSMQYFFLNGRLVKSKTAMAAVEQAYKSNIMVGKFPVCVINIQIPPETVDVNVHPSKVEVRFSDEKRIFDAVYYSVKNALDIDRSSHNVVLDKPKQIKMTEPEPPQQITFAQSVKNDNFWQNKSAAEYKNDIPERSEKLTEMNFSHASFAVNDSSSFGSVGEKEPSTLEMQKPKYSEVHYNKPLTAVKNSIIRETPKAETAEEITPSVADEQPKQKEEITVEATTEQAAGVCQAIPEKEIDFRLVGEAFDTYIIAEINNELNIIDKHAAHERLIYEKLKKAETAHESQMLLAPVTVTVSKEEYACAVENLELFSRVGFDVDDFGSGTLIVRACPIGFEQSEVEPTVVEMAGHLLHSKTDITPEKLDWLYQNIACRSAIKAGNKTTPTENEALVKQLLANGEVRYCPHGRPIMVTMTRYELEKQFKRV